MMILYPATLLNCCLISGSLGAESFGFFTLSTSSVRRESLTSCLPIWIPFISLCCLIAVVRTSHAMLNKICESEHPCHVPDLKAAVVSFYPLRMVFTVGFS